MKLNYNGCWITIEDTLIQCSYLRYDGTKRWQIVLDDTFIRYRPGSEKEILFNVADIQEFQFEMVNGAYKQGDIPAASAYMVLKNDPDPKELFYFSIGEEYVLLNQTKSYDFCNIILGSIGERYGIPVNYKLSIDTKKKRNAIALVPLILIITFLLIWLRFKLGL